MAQLLIQLLLLLFVQGMEVVHRLRKSLLIFLYAPPPQNLNLFCVLCKHLAQLGLLTQLIGHQALQAWAQTRGVLQQLIRVPRLPLKISLFFPLLDLQTTGTGGTRHTGIGRILEGEAI